MKEDSKIGRRQIYKNDQKATYLASLGWLLEHVRPTAFIALEVNGPWDWITSFIHW